jgi:hypothetical protein
MLMDMLQPVLTCHPDWKFFPKGRTRQHLLLPDCLEFFSYGLIYFMRWIRIARFQCIAVLLQPNKRMPSHWNFLESPSWGNFCPVVSDRLHCLYLKLAWPFSISSCFHNLWTIFIMLSQCLNHFHRAFTISASFSHHALTIKWIFTSCFQ